MRAPGLRNYARAAINPLSERHCPQSTRFREKFPNCSHSVVLVLGEKESAKGPGTTEGQGNRPMQSPCKDTTSALYNTLPPAKLTLRAPEHCGGLLNRSNCNRCPYASETSALTPKAPWKAPRNCTAIPLWDRQLNISYLQPFSNEIKRDLRRIVSNTSAS